MIMDLQCMVLASMAPHRSALETFSLWWSEHRCTAPDAVQMPADRFSPVPCASSFLSRLLRFSYRQSLRIFCLLKPIVSTLKVALIPWMATERSTELKLVADNSLSDSCMFLPFWNGPPPLRLIRFCDRCSPHRFDPPWVYGMLSSAMPCRWGPFARSSDTPSHLKSKSVYC